MAESSLNSNWLEETWPSLPQGAWSETCATLQLWALIVGKIRLALSTPINHAWNVALYPTIRGLNTSPMPCGSRFVQIDFDFVEHKLVLEVNQSGRRTVTLRPMTVADFYRQIMSALDGLGCPIRIWPTPVEIADPIPFDQDEVHRSYDPEFAQRFWRVLLQTTRVFTQISGEVSRQG